MTTTRLLLALVLLVTCSVSLSAQQYNWRKHRSIAEDAAKAGDLYTAAENYRMAWEQKKSKKDLLFEAAKNYLHVRDYRAAAEAYQYLEGDTKADPLVGLKYARALKQDGQYDRAREVFQRTIENYSGADRTILEDIIRIELRGIDLAQELAARPDRRYELNLPGAAINSDDNEFAPTPVGTDQIFFTSTMGGQSRIYESMRQGRDWTKANTPEGFPVINNGQYAGGTMSPDGQRFYFTICNADGGWKGLNTRCEIYATDRSPSGWSQPERLPEYINIEGKNNTHPNVVHVAGRELLYFASNRDGGRGGMDLWYAVRDLGSDQLDFTFPVNLGPAVNTLGDEITPFYSTDERKLYFSSNGHATIGGFDVMVSEGDEINWSAPQNVGIPINSSADDYGFVLDRTGFGNGFIVSNRVFGGQKINTRHSDIFEFAVGGRQITLRSNVYDQSAGSLLNNINVSLYQIYDNGTENLLVTKAFPTGSYLFELLPNRRYRVEVAHPNFETASYTLSTNDPNVLNYGQPLFLEPGAGFAGNTNPSTTNPSYPSTNPSYPSTNPSYPSTNPSYPSTNPSYPSTSNPNPTTPSYPSTNVNVPPTNPNTSINTSGQTYTARGTSNSDNLKYESNAPRYEGTYYKVQLVAVGKFNPAATQYQSLRTMGTIETEVLPNRNLTRVLLANFFSQQEAQSALQQARNAGFGSAFLVRYDNGIRYGRVNF